MNRESGREYLPLLSTSMNLPMTRGEGERQRERVRERERGEKKEVDRRGKYGEDRKRRNGQGEVAG